MSFEQDYKLCKQDIKSFEQHIKPRSLNCIIRHFVKNNSRSSSIPPLENGQNTYSYTDQEKAECLNDFLTSVSAINDDNRPLPTFELKCQNKLTSLVCTPEEIQSLIEILNPIKQVDQTE